MKMILALSLAGVAATLAPAAAIAQTYASNFSNLGTQGADGYYFFTGHTATQTFTATGLSSVSQFELSLMGGLYGNYVTEPLSLTFQINGVDVGTTTYNPGNPANRLLSFIFGPINSASTDYTLSAFVSDPVCGGCGAVQFGTGNAFRLTAASAVPEASTWAMMLLGFGAIGYAVRRSRKAGLPALIG